MEFPTLYNMLVPSTPMSLYGLDGKLVLQLRRCCTLVVLLKECGQVKQHQGCAERERRKMSDFPAPQLFLDCTSILTGTEAYAKGSTSFIEHLTFWSNISAKLLNRITRVVNSLRSLHQVFKIEIRQHMSVGIILEQFYKK